MTDVQPSERIAGQPIDHTKRLKEPAADRTRESSALIRATEEDWEILRALKLAHPRLLTQKEIGMAVRIHICRRTIQKRLAILRDDKGLVVQPDGPKSGSGLSDAGFKAVTGVP